MLVVAVETDWNGARIDHPDREAFDLIMNRAIVRTRNPSMGLELRRCFAAAGLVALGAEAMIWGLNDVAELHNKIGVDLTEPAAELIAEGRLDRERAQATVDYLATASRDGVFFAYGGMVMATGSVSDRP